MAETVFVLGAGASRSAGAPLMDDFLDKAEDLFRIHAASNLEAFQIVFDAIAKLQVVDSKCDLGSLNIESFFSTCEMAKTLGRFPGYKDSKQIDRLIAATKKVIVMTLENSMRFPDQGSMPSPPGDYKAFGELILKMKDFADRAQTVAVLTFNYDLGVDYGLWANRKTPYYAVDSVLEETSNTVPLLKLHGSLNWGQKAGGKDLRIVTVEEINQSVGYRPFPAVNGWVVSCEPWFKAEILEPVIVPPTFNKEDSHRRISAVWKRAAFELGEAQNIFVIGYSMPPSDQFFKYLFALGTVGSKRLRRFWVFDPAIDRVKERFETILGPSAKARFDYFRSNFAQSIQHLTAEFGLPPTK